MTEESPTPVANQRASRKKFILWFLLPYIVYLFAHQFLLSLSLCATIGKFNASHLSAIVAFFWPAMMVFLLVMLFRGKEFFVRSKKMLTRQLPANIFNIGCLVFLIMFILLLVYSWSRANQQFNQIDTKMKSGEWTEVHAEHCT